MKRQSWKFHAMVISVTVAVVTPLLTAYVLTLGVDYPLPLLLLMITTNITNLLALSYSVYVYSLYDRARTQAVERLKKEGVEVVSLEDGISQILSKTKPLMEWLENNDEQIKNLLTRAGKIDMNAILRFIDDTNEIYEAIRGKFEKKDVEKMLDMVKEMKERDDWLKPRK